MVCFCPFVVKVGFQKLRVNRRASSNTEIPPLEVSVKRYTELIEEESNLPLKSEPRNMVVHRSRELSGSVSVPYGGDDRRLGCACSERQWLALLLRRQ